MDANSICLTRGDLQPLFIQDQTETIAHLLIIKRLAVQLLHDPWCNLGETQFFRLPVLNDLLPHVNILGF